MNKTFYRDQYYFLTDLLDSLKWQLRGSCEDIDCDKFMYLSCLKKSIKPVLKHEYSCLPKIIGNCAFVSDLLNDKKFAQFRYEKCPVCHKKMDSLDDNNPLTAFIKKIPRIVGKEQFHQCITKRTHKSCKKKLKAPTDFERWIL